MCGVVGAIGSKESNLVERVNKANSLLSHRGPDGHGINEFECMKRQVVLAHSRLSIIDLTDLGHQPMSSADGKYWITYNGEFYNYKEIRIELESLGYKFRSDSDTEVLLNSWIEWRLDCLRKITGMFAFAIYDVEAGSITCARDAFGIKPFYYYYDKDQFYFSSETPSLLQLLEKKESLNAGSIINYLLRSSYDFGRYTLTRGVHSLRPGSYITVTINEQLHFSEDLWWKPSIVENVDISFEEAAQRVRELFLESVRVHLRSDVPIGAALSGGIDSSAIVCAIRHLEPDLPIHTFSYIASNTSVNEEKWVDLVNSHIKAIPHKVKLDYQDLVEELDDVIQAQGEPFGSTSIYAQYRIFKHAKEQGISVILEGQGADELLAGYFGYPHHRALSLFDKKEFKKLYNFINGWAVLHSQPKNGILKYLFLHLLTITYQAFYLGVKKITKLFADRNSRSQNGSWIGRLITSIFNFFLAPTPPEWLIDVDGSLMAEADKQLNADGITEVDFGRRLMHELRKAVQGSGLSSLLRHGDRNAMKWSVENRVPFLTLDIAEFIFTLPEEYLVSQGGQTKRIFREAMRGIVPDAVLDRQDKIGFATPEQEWITKMGSLDLFKAYDQIKFIDQRAIRNERDDMLNGTKPFNWFTWRVLNLSRWLELNRNHLYLNNQIAE
jgi:asparagine synthase (glutamine-hydrolysing)